MTKTEEPIHVTFARVARKVHVWEQNGKWYYRLDDWGSFDDGWPLPDVSKDRAFCQELAEINGVNLTYCKSGKTWSSEVVSDELAERIFGRLSESMCETIITWAIAATEAGVPVRLPGGER